MRLGDTGLRIPLILLFLLLLGWTTYEIVQYRRASAYYAAAQGALQRRDFSLASSYLERCLSIWSSDLSVRLLAAQTARRQGDYAEALRHLRFYEAKNGPPDASVLEQQLIRLQRGDLEEANTMYSFCIEHIDAPETPFIIEALLEGGLTSLESIFAAGVSFETSEAGSQLAKAQHAIALWLRLRTARADQAQGLLWRGRAYLLAGEHDNAVADLREALQLEPERSDVRVLLARNIAQTSPEEATAHFQIVRDRKSDDRDARFELAVARRGVGQTWEAGQILDEILVENPGDLSALVERSLVDMDMDQPASAEIRLRRALLLAPDEPRVNLAMSRCLRLSGKVEEARQYQDRFLRIEGERKRSEEQTRQYRDNFLKTEAERRKAEFSEKWKHPARP